MEKEKRIFAIRASIRALGVAAAYFATVELGFVFSTTSAGVSPVWPAAGVALAFTFIYGYWVLGIIFATAFAIYVTSGMPVMLAVLMGLGNVLEPFLGVILVRWTTRAVWPLGNPKDLVKFLVSGAVLSTIPCALLGVASVCAAGRMAWADYATAVRVWWLGDMFGVLVVAPFILSWTTRSNLPSRVRGIEILILMVLLVICSETFVGGWFSKIVPQDFHKESFLIPVLLWAAFRFSERGMTASIVILAAISTWETAHGTGIFILSNPVHSIHNLQLFIASTATTMLMVNAVRHQHERAQIALKNSETRYHSIVENVPLNFYQKDLRGKLVFVNSTYQKFLQRPVTDLLGKGDHDLFPKELADQYVADDRKVIETRRPLVIPAEHHLTSDGRELIVEVIKAPVTDAEGRVIGTTGVFWDITERKRMEEQLRLSKELADEASRSKSQFVANVSHEIRTPLGVILGYAERIESSDLTDAERVHCVDNIRRNISVLTALIDDILDLSKVEAGKLKIERVPVNLLHMVNDLAGMLKQQASEKSLYLHFQSDGAIPETIRTDPVRLRQILVNIVGNAIKFTRFGGVTVTVAVKAAESETTESKLVFLISDTGCGIATIHHEEIFRPFAQVDGSTTREFGGTGLGLSLSRILAQSLGGNVTLVDSAIDKGSTFALEIAAGSLEGVAMITGLASHTSRKEAATAQNGTASPALTDMEILVVEDSVPTQELLKYFLTKNGANVNIAVNGLDAVEYCSKKEYDVVLMDIQMPVLDGYAATRRLRDRGYTKPIVALTARAMTEERLKCHESGFDGFITKPVARDILVQTVERFRKRPERAFIGPPPIRSVYSMPPPGTVVTS